MTTTEAPSDLLDALSQDREWSEEETYWAAWAASSADCAALLRPLWVGMYRTAEEAERFPLKEWMVSLGPPKPTTLEDSMRSARAFDRPGVELRAYLDSEWVVLKRWEVSPS